MGKMVIREISIEDYYGSPINTIKLNEPVEISIDDFEVKRFDVSSVKKEILHIEFSEEGYFSLEDIDDTINDFMDFIRYNIELESVEEGEVYDIVYGAINQIMGN